MIEMPDIIWTEHAAKRFVERGLEAVEVVDALRTGFSQGFFKRAQKFRKGKVAVVAHIHNGQLVVITVSLTGKRKGIKRNQRKKAMHKRRGNR